MEKDLIHKCMVEVNLPALFAPIFIGFKGANINLIRGAFYVIWALVTDFDDRLVMWTDHQERVLSLVSICCDIMERYWDRRLTTRAKLSYPVGRMLREHFESEFERGI